MGNVFVLPWSTVLDFVDSTTEALPSVRSGWEVEWQEVDVKGGEREWELGLVCSMRKDFFK